MVGSQQGRTRTGVDPNSTLPILPASENFKIAIYGRYQNSRFLFYQKHRWN